jgi:membrane protein insertase Oxa1/YidC/SpoIIIJ
MLYSFVHAPLSVNMVFLGLIDISHKSIILALLAGLSTYLQVRIANSAGNTASPAAESDMAKAMRVQMQYFLPALMAFVAYTISSGVAIYLITSNLFAIAQEYYIKKKYHKAVFVE